MRGRKNINSLNIDRKTLMIIFGVVLVSVFTLTVVYAALSTTLTINGNAEVSAANWDIHFDNIKVDGGSVTPVTAATISNGKLVSFGVNLTKPGDYYKFNVDVVNNGSIDAMIDSVVKSPDLTEEQKKYITYDISYSDGAAIATKQILEKNTTKTLSVEVAYRRDLVASDLPTGNTTLNLSFTAIYTQADDSAIAIAPPMLEMRIISGDLETPGSEIALGNEHFYVLPSTDYDEEGFLKLFAKYNLNVGGVTEAATENWVPYEDGGTGRQDPDMIGFNSDDIYYGVLPYPNVYGNEYLVYYDTAIENYANYLITGGIELESIRSIYLSELKNLGCTEATYTCTTSQYDWIYSSSYWLDSSMNSSTRYYVDINGTLDGTFSGMPFYGLRPVVIIPKP